MPITSYREFIARLNKIFGDERKEIETLWRRGFQAEAIARVEALTN